MSLNHIVLMGRLTADPEIKTTNSGLSVVSFSVACDRNYGKDQEKQTDFIPCTAWRQTAEFIGKYFHKGSMIAVEGAMQSRKYTDKDGKNRIVYEVLVERVHFTGERSNASSQDAGFSEAKNYTEMYTPVSDPSDPGDLPF